MHIAFVLLDEGASFCPVCQYLKAETSQRFSSQISAVLQVGLTLAHHKTLLFILVLLLLTVHNEDVMLYYVVIEMISDSIVMFQFVRVGS